MPSTNMLRRKDTETAFFSDYPIEVSPVTIYIPKEEGAGEKSATTAASIGSTIAKPVTMVLMIVATPVAVTVVKILQALEFLMFINAKNLPSNVLTILAIAGEGDVFEGMLDPVMGDFWLFDDGKKDNDESTAEQSEENSVNFDEQRRVLAQETQNGDTITAPKSPVCQIHKVLDKQEMSCMGWNNVASFVLQFILILIGSFFANLFGNKILKNEKKKLREMDMKAKTENFQKIDGDNLQIKIKRSWFQRLIMFCYHLLTFKFIMNFLLAVELDLLLGAFVGIKYTKFDNFVNIFNFMISSTIIVFYAGVTAFLTYKIFLFSKITDDKIEN